MKRYRGTKEDRINRWHRMCLEWQYDIKNNQKKKSKYYFRKYNIGNNNSSLFHDIANAEITKDWVINKMRECAAYKKETQQKFIERKLQKQIIQPSLFDNIEDNDNISHLEKVSTEDIINEIKKRGFQVIKSF